MNYQPASKLLNNLLDEKLKKKKVDLSLPLSTWECLSETVKAAKSEKNIDITVEDILQLVIKQSLKSYIKKGAI